MTEPAPSKAAPPELAERIARVHEGLPALLPAQETLGSPTAAFADDERFSGRVRGDYVYVQGRGDRLHLFLCVPAAGAIDSALLDAFAGSDANWRWLVVPDERLVNDFVAIAERRGLGLVLSPASGPLQKRLDASPNPGIFIKSYPALRKEWRKLASW